MLGSSEFWTGAVVGVVGVWAWHRWVKPMATTKSGG